MARKSPARHKAPIQKPAQRPRKTKPLIAKEHPWRECPTGHHWVTAHIKQRKPSKTHPDGLTPYHSFCRINPTHKSSIYSQELHVISEKYFKGLGKGLPKDPLFKHRDQFDDSIAGWTKYWNDIFKPKDPLQAALIKALIATESSFNSKVKDQKAGRAGMARGILQITDEAQTAMNKSNTEIIDYLVHVTRPELKNPNLNIAAGIRWLFHKKDLTSSTLRREATWYETVVFYKGYGPAFRAGKSIEEMSGAKDIVEAYQRITGKNLKR